MNNIDQQREEPQSEVTEALQNVDANQIQSNLKNPNQTDKPESLTAEQATPFIDDDVRTDK